MLFITYTKVMSFVYLYNIFALREKIVPLSIFILSVQLSHTSHVLIICLPTEDRPATSAYL